MPAIAGHHIQCSRSRWNAFSKAWTSVERGKMALCAGTITASHGTQVQVAGGVGPALDPPDPLEAVRVVFGAALRGGVDVVELAVVGLFQAAGDLPVAAGDKNAQMFNSFLDGTKSAIEMAAVANATALTDAVARGLFKLMAYKDEYEVARLYTNGDFETALKNQFESWDGLRFHMAPPLMSKPGPDGRAKKMVFGGWMWKSLRVLAKFKGLRGGPLDVFGYHEERRIERQLIADYEALVAELIRDLSADKLELAVQLARLPERIRGYGHVKLGNIAAVRKQWAEMLSRYRSPATTQQALATP